MINVKTLTFTVLAAEDGMMLKNWLRSHNISTRTTVKLKHYGRILLCGEPVTVRAIVHSGDVIELRFPDDKKPAEAENITVPVLYADENVIVMDKPAHMPVHPSKDLQSGTLANAFASFAESRGHRLAFRAVNRLDRGTSGLVVVALDQISASKLAGKVDKEYLCVCHGEIPETGRIDQPIRRKEESKMERCVAPDGQKAVTNFRRIYTNGEISVALVTLETGRTHQIRVHFSYSGFPLVGDTMYGYADAFLDRQALHCLSVSFTQPISGETINVKSEMPDDISAYLAAKNIKLNLGDKK